MEQHTVRIACVFLIALAALAVLLPPAATAAVGADTATKLTLIHYPGYGFGGRLTDLNGHQLSFTELARIRLYKDGICVKRTTACGMGYYRFPMGVSHGSYQVKFRGQPGLKPSASRTVTV